MGYKNDAAKGFAWLGALRIFVRGTSFLRIAILARLLTPVQFGFFGVASIVLSVMEILTETGVNIVLIQSEDFYEKHVSTAWIISIFRGLLISAVIFLSAPYVSNFFNSPSSTYLIQLISIVPILRGFINPSIVRFSRDLHFNKEFYYRSSVFLIEAVASIILVIYLKSPVGIVWGLIASALFEVVISFMIIKPRPGLEFDSQIFKVIVGRGKWITLGGIFNYLYKNLDNMVIARLLGPASLGLYDMAYRISLLPITEVADIVGKITFPVYTKISGDRDRLKKAFKKTTLFISLLVIPFGIFIFLFSNTIIDIALGSKWMAAAPALQALAIFGILQAIMYPMMTLLLSLKRQDLCTVINLVNLLGIAVVIIPLTKSYGIVGASWAAVIGSVFGLLVSVYYAQREIDR